MQELMDVATTLTLNMEEGDSVLHYFVRQNDGMPVIGIEMERGDTREISEASPECTLQEAFSLLGRLAAGVVFPVSLQEIVEDYNDVRRCRC